MNEVKVYVDGSCLENPGIGGWSVVLCYPFECKTLKGSEAETTNNRMELTALIEALKKITTDGDAENEKYTIYSDSAYVVNAIKQNWLENWKCNGWKTKNDEDVKNKDLWQSLDNLIYALSDKRQLWALVKIKGHSGNSFNEMADSIAKEQAKLLKKNKNI